MRLFCLYICGRPGAGCALDSIALLSLINYLHFSKLRKIPAITLVAGILIIRNNYDFFMTQKLSLGQDVVALGLN
ncbi:hypothetical protein GCM10022405_16510 [Gibbsiella dentisursi]|uniref:Uncharacterized protein n=1 Tax=Gibbsiella dentisursi TaxID=796890 RepID=A0ABP7L0T8_9GAMM